MDNDENRVLRFVCSSNEQEERGDVPDVWRRVGVRLAGPCDGVRASGLPDPRQRQMAGKWGSAAGTTRTAAMRWANLDQAYNFAQANNLPFNFHVLVWGNQQPTW